MVNSAEFAKRLQKILDHFGLSATAFSERLEFNRSTISHLLSGRNKPSLEFVMKVLKEFPEVELYWLLNGTGSFPADRRPPIQRAESKPQDTVLSKKESEASGAKQITSTEKDQTDIERIVIFYKDGSFKSYS